MANVQLTFHETNRSTRKNAAGFGVILATRNTGELALRNTTRQPVDGMRPPPPRSRFRLAWQLVIERGRYRWT